MNKQKYLNDRKALLDEAQKLMEAGDQAAFDAKCKEIEALDTQYEAYARNAANLNALQGAQAVPMANANQTPQGAQSAGAASFTGGGETITAENFQSTAAYHSAYFKRLRNQDEQLTEEEEAAFVHTTGMENAPLPTTTLDQIWDLVNGAHTLLGDVNRLPSGTQITITKHKSIKKGKAKKTAEGEANDAEENEFIQVTLGGNDYSKFVDLSYKMAKMAIPALEKYLVEELAKQLGGEMSDDAYAQAVTDMAAENKISVQTVGKLTYTELCDAFGALERVDNVVVYGKRKTIFKHLVGMVDDHGAPILQKDPTGKVIGVALDGVIKIDDSVPAGKLLIVDPKKILFNIVTDILLETDRDIKKHVITHSGYACGEFCLVDDKAAVLLTVG